MMKLTKEILRNKLLNDAIRDSHNTATEINSSTPSTACDGNKCYGMFLQSLWLLDDFNLITPKQSEKVTDLIPNDEAVSKYLKKIK